MNVASLKALDIATDTTTLDEVTAAIGTMSAGITELRAQLAHDDASTTEEEAAHAATLLPTMGAVRTAADGLEALVADDLWPLPTYQEMLFIL